MQAKFQWKMLGGTDFCGYSTKIPFLDQLSFASVMKRKTNKFLFFFFLETKMQKSKISIEHL